MSKKINDYVIEFNSLEEAQFFVINKYGQNAVEFGIENQDKFLETKNASKFYAITFNFDLDNMIDDYDISIRDLFINTKLNEVSFVCAANKKKDYSLIRDIKYRLKYDNTHCCLVLSSNTIIKVKGVVEIIVALVPKTQIDWFEFVGSFYTKYQLTK